MRAVARWTLRICLFLVGILAIAAAVVFGLTQVRLTHTYAIAAETVAMPTDPEGVARGQHVATISGCVDCHGPDLAGRVFFDNPMVGRFVASNLTRGNGGVGARFGDADWIRAIRHGVRPDGKPLLVMPAKEYFGLSDEDLGALIGYLKTLPPVDRELPRSSVSPMGRVLMVALKDMAILSAERIDHTAARPAAPTPGITREYGAYLAVRCTGCHGDTLSGGKIPGTPPDWPPALNLTPYEGAAAAVWSEPQFIHAMRTGMTPAGRQLDRKYMPWPVLGQMTDEELKALWMYLQAAPARAYGNR
jgi:mono/diheme cytochrome c family protein